MRTSAKTLPRRTQLERRETTRRLLIDAAIDCICERGFAASTLELITERAGVTRGSVQHHFGTRDELLLTVVEDLNDKMSASTDTKLLSGKSLSDRLVWICEQLWETFSSRHFMAVIQIQLDTVTDSNLAPRVLKIMIKIEDDLDSRWVRLFAEDGVPPDRIIVLRHVAQATLRGLSIKQIYRKRKEKSETERALLLNMLQYAFRSERRVSVVR